MDGPTRSSLTLKREEDLKTKIIRTFFHLSAPLSNTRTDKAFTEKFKIIKITTEHKTQIKLHSMNRYFQDFLLILVGRRHVYP
jgi:hypothetical protein